MRRIFAISPENEFADEINVVPKLVESGLEAYHLRRPQESSRDVADFLGRMPSPAREKVVLHQHHELAERFEIGGLHWKDNGDSADAYSDPMENRHRVRTRSRSLHSLKNWAKAIDGWDYVFLSPVFPSISKAGYEVEWNLPELTHALDQATEKGVTVAALGGICKERIEDAFQLGFSGVVLHGTLWEDQEIEPIVRKWRSIFS
tara:strand:+ start:2583 stop:3194 length:612 start_codon:yes stop_codon:yes gene_type:complete